MKHFTHYIVIDDYAKSAIEAFKNVFPVVYKVLIFQQLIKRFPYQCEDSLYCIRFSSFHGKLPEYSGTNILPDHPVHTSGQKICNNIWCLKGDSGINGKTIFTFIFK